MGVLDKNNEQVKIDKPTSPVSVIPDDIAVQKTLAHPNIITFQDIVLSNNQITPLTEILRKREIDASTVRSYFKQLLEVLNFCHCQGIHHHNLHADLLFVDANGKLKVMGFETKTIYRSVYSAPEVIAGKDYQIEKIESWACGIILHLLVTRSMPDPIQLHRGDFEFMEEADGLIAHLLTLDPSRRYSLISASQHSWLVKKKHERKLNSSQLDFKELINDALPGRTDAVIEIFARKLARVNIEHRDDLKLLASLFKSPNRLAVWLEEKSHLPAFACMRLARYMFKQ